MIELLDFQKQSQRNPPVLRLLHLYAGNMYGGIERLLTTFARERHVCPFVEPTFGLCFQGRLSEELASAGVSVHHLGAVRFSRPWTLWQARWRLHQLLRKEQFDVVLTHAAWPHAAFARTVRNANVPLAHWVHDVMTGSGNVFEQRASRVRPDLVIANSQFTAGSAIKVFPEIPTEVVYLPVSTPGEASTDRFAVRTDLRTPQNDVVIVQACRLERWKGHEVLLDALGEIKNIPGWTAWIAGGPQKAGEAEYLAELQARAAGFGIAERVRFLGQRSDVSRLLAAADVLCQPNTGPEPFGIAFVEALYAGLPIVTTDIGGGREVVDARCGVLVPPNDSRAVANALAGLIANTSGRNAMAAAGPARAAQLCDPARQLGRVEQLLRKVAA